MKGKQRYFAWWLAPSWRKLGTSEFWHPIHAILPSALISRPGTPGQSIVVLAQGHAAHFMSEPKLEFTSSAVVALDLRSELLGNLGSSPGITDPIWKVGMMSNPEIQ